MTAAGERLQRFLDDHPALAIVRIATAWGSTPRDDDAWMLVAAHATFGTIGGGQLEYRAIAAARDLLAVGGVAHDLEIPLGPDIGQCCGGRVALAIARLRPADRAAIAADVAGRREAAPHVCLFGAGHVGRALASAMALLPVNLTLADTREAELALAPAGVATRLTAVPEDLVRRAPPQSAFVILTHDHALDFLIAREALARGDAAYVGMIGSRTKRATFESWARDQAPGLDTAQLVCPIGAAGTGDKRPEVIAAFTAAEVMAALGR